MDAAPAPSLRPAATRLVGCAARLVAMLAMGVTSVPAIAQFAGSLSVSSRALFRGRDVSDHRPAIEMELVHDGTGGFYLGGSVAAVATQDEGLKPLSVKVYAGFARQLPSGRVIDVGAVHGEYSDYSGIHGRGSYSEVHVGLVGGNVSGRIYFSPAYFRADAPTLYMEVEGHLPLAKDWSLLGHAGMLTHLRDQPDGGGRTVPDWRIGVRRRLGPVDLDIAWSGYREGGSRHHAYGDRKGSALAVAMIAGF
ncbi:TorF family putative porin [Sphingobium lactosutens]|uniref:TorF family putative porin n=1 Tax=Sphingobium lactosutens TaxID=522773 RepID=UPI0015BE7F79|nr:TorF family putative porin [Sphingobium lactosutens]